MRCTLLALLAALMPLGAMAQDMVSDAFGLYRPGPETRARSRWADSGRVEAGPVQSVLIFAGPKSLIAGSEQGHLLSLSFDADGNLAGRMARFGFHDGQVAMAPVTQGIAAHLFAAGPVARDFLASVTVDGRQSQRADYSVTADLASLSPRVLAPETAVAPDVAIDLPLAAMQDQFGNPVPDGIALRLGFIDAAGHHGQATAVSLSGAAMVPMILRDVAGPLQITPHLGRQAGAPVGLAIQGALALGPLRLAGQGAPGIDAVSLSIGPLQTTLGYQLPDGTPVEVLTRGASGVEHRAQGWALDGYVTGLVPVSPTDLPIYVLVRSMLGVQAGRILDLGHPPSIRAAQ